MAIAVSQLEEAARRDPTQSFQFAPFWTEPELRRRLEEPRDRRRVLAIGSRAPTLPE